MRMTLTSAAILSALAFPPLIEAAPTAPVRQGPKAIDPAENGIGRWIPDVEFISVKGKRGRLSDFKSDEYANLVGGELYEPDEDNPMIGFRGASRYVAPSFRAAFAMECKALKRVRDDMGLTNVELMVPFVRTLDEADHVVQLLATEGLRRGENGLRIVMMCEIPSNALLADEFLERFDGFSIGSNDLTQLTLALDRNSGLIANLFDERDPAVKALLHLAIQACRRHDKYVGICGQGPSDHPDLARWLMHEGITSVSLNPDSVVETWLFLGEESTAERSGARR